MGMKSLSKQTRQLFKEAGRQGGRRRARGLSAVRRRDIASAAARVRWQKASPGGASALLASVRLRETRWSDPVYLEEVLSFGTLADWRVLYRYLHDRPFGPEARALEKVCQCTSIYGATPIWKDTLRS